MVDISLEGPCGQGQRSDWAESTKWHCSSRVPDCAIDSSAFDRQSPTHQTRMACQMEERRLGGARICQTFAVDAQASELEPAPRRFPKAPIIFEKWPVEIDSAEWRLVDIDLDVEASQAVSCVDSALACGDLNHCQTGADMLMYLARVQMLLFL
ncbi:uncharacterized protein ACBT44_007663 isoform 2-T2 [Syngnathus typhle]